MSTISYDFETSELIQLILPNLMAIGQFVTAFGPNTFREDVQMKYRTV